MSMTIENVLVDLLVEALCEEPANSRLPSMNRNLESQERYLIAKSHVDLAVEPIVDSGNMQESFAFTALSRRDDGLLSSSDVLGLLELVRVVASGYAEMSGESDMTRVTMDWVEKGIYDLQVNLNKMYGMAERGIVLPRRAK